MFGKSASDFCRESDLSVLGDSSCDTDECARRKEASVTSNVLDNFGFWPRASDLQMFVCALARNRIRPGGATRDMEQTSLCAYPSAASAQTEDQKEAGAADGRRGNRRGWRV